MNIILQLPSISSLPANSVYWIEISTQMIGSNPQLDPFFENAKKWRAELQALRNIVLRSGLSEERKWYQPAYSIDGKNVAIISSFKEYCILSFFKGALLKDPKGLLKQAGANTQSARTIRFTSVEEILSLETTLSQYLQEAIANEKAGLKVRFKSIDEHAVPEELTTVFAEMPDLQRAFQALTPGRQRGYLLFFAGAKQSQTRISRIEKHIPRILAGKGLDDK